MRKYILFLKAFCFCVLFFLCGKIFQYLLIDDTGSYTRIMMHELYHQESNIDVLFAGSSHCYRSFVPEAADKIFQKNTFNAGSSSQGLDGSMQMIREASDLYDIEHIYLEIFCYFAFLEPYKERTEMTSTYILSDYMKPSLHKIKYLLNAGSKEHYVHGFIPARRNWQKFFESDYICSLLKQKMTKDYQSYAYTYVSGDTEYYAGKGFVASNSQIFRGGDFGHQRI